MDPKWWEQIAYGYGKLVYAYPTVRREMKKIGIVIVGYGYIGKIHTLALRQLPLIYPDHAGEFQLVGICMRSEEKAKRAAAEMGCQKWYAAYKDVLQDDEVNIVDLVTPNYLHLKMIEGAIRGGKHVLCEKPLTLTRSEAEEVVKFVRASKASLGMIFNYRFIPALLKAKQMLEQGLLGRIYNFRGEYYHTGYQDPGRPITWRTDFSKSGGGALVDLGVHVVDLVRYLLGDFDSVQAVTETYITGRPLERGSRQIGSVTVDDAAWMNVRMKSGAMGSIEVSRFATGTLDDLKITVYGERGSLRFSLMDANFLYWFDVRTPDLGLVGWQRLETGQTYPGAKLPNPRSIIGWTRFHTENIHRFIRSVKDETSFAPNEVDGYEAQAVLEAAYDSAESGLWSKVKTWGDINS
jgi:predicted dehydrogenase